MGEEVGGELVVIPHKAVLDVVLNGIERNLGKVFIKDKTVETLHEGIDAKCLYSRLPWMFLLIVGIIKGEYGSGALPFLLNHLSQILSIWAASIEATESDSTAFGTSAIAVIGRNANTLITYLFIF